MAKRLNYASLKNIHLLNKLEIVCDSQTGQALELKDDYVMESQAKEFVDMLRRFLMPEIRKGKFKYYLTEKKIQDFTPEEEQALYDCTDEIIAVIEKYRKTLKTYPKTKKISYDSYIKNENKYKSQRKANMLASGNFIRDVDNPDVLIRNE